jgi:hypothetical protein
MAALATTTFGHYAIVGAAIAIGVTLGMVILRLVLR